MTEDYRIADRDLSLGHPWLQERLPLLEARLLDRYGWRLLRVEIYRPELRQEWLYGSGRSVPELTRHGISLAFSRRGPILTNAWSARVSAHGFLLDGKPAAAAVDCDPLGADSKPFTADDPWDDFMKAMAVEGVRSGLVHFHSKGKVTDRPHLELLEWSNREHTVTDRPDPND